MSDWIECICSVDIRKVTDGIWVDRDGGTLCYPEAKDEESRAAPHEPYELESEQ